MCPLEIESHHCKTLPSLPAPCLLHSQHISKEENTDGNEAFGGMDIRHMKAQGKAVCTLLTMDGLKAGLHR